MAKYHAFYDATEDKGLIAAFALKHKYGSDISFTNTYGKDASAMTAAVAALDDDTYTSIFVLVDNAATHAAGNFTNDQIASLRDKMITASKGTTIDSGTCQANSTATEIVLAATASASNDTYNGMYIVTDGTTEVFRAIADYVGTTTTATVVSTGTAITTTETYIVYTMSQVKLFGATDSNGKTTGQQTWEVIYPDTQVPLLFHYMSKYKSTWDYGTASAANGTTITLAASAGDGAIKARANDVFNGGYVYIYSATTNKGSYAKISDFATATHVATLDDTGWVGGTPATSVVYRIMPNDKELFFDAYAELAVKTYFNDITSASQLNEFEKLIDSNGKLNDVAAPATPEQDLELLYEYLDKGKAIFDYSCL